MGRSRSRDRRRRDSEGDRGGREERGGDRGREDRGGDRGRDDRGGDREKSRRDDTRDDMAKQIAEARGEAGGRDDNEKRRDRSRDRGDKSSRKEEETKPKEKEEKEDLEFKSGRRVVVHGLAKNPEKNGAIGVLGDFNKEKARWAVDFSSGSSNNFKEDNLEVLPDVKEDDDDEEAPTAKIYITNLSADTTDKDLIALFGGLGVIAKETQRSSKGGAKGFADQWPYAVKLYKPGRDKGDGCLEYQDKLAAKAAIRTYNGYRLKGSRIGVAYAGTGKKYEERELTLPWAEREENQSKVNFD